MRRTHVVALPSPIDTVALWCGESLYEADRRDFIGPPALATCVGCLRAVVARRDLEIEQLKAELERARPKVPA